MKRECVSGSLLREEPLPIAARGFLDSSFSIFLHGITYLRPPHLKSGWLGVHLAATIGPRLEATMAAKKKHPAKKAKAPPPQKRPQAPDEADAAAPLTPEKPLGFP